MFSLSAVFNRFRASYLRSLGLLLLSGCTLSSLAQTFSAPTCPGEKNTTTISGTVYTPNGNDPLPDVLVYIPDGPPVTIPNGVTCTDLRPTSPLAKTTTAFDGTFVLTGVPAGTNVPLVIQSGKWQRVLTVSTVTACQDNPLVDPPGDRFARFPRDHTEGNIPKIAIVTGSIETSECVLRRVGIKDSEFTNAVDGGRINIYAGSQRPGATINADTPGEMSLMSDRSQLGQYDMLLFPCQGADQRPTVEQDANLVAFANAGGRVFINHHSHGWLRDNTGFGDGFTWSASDPAAEGSNYPSTIDQSFTMGATMAEWLQTIDATTTKGQIPVSNVGATLASVNPALAQTWITLNSNSLPVQATFDTPIGSAQGAACGRVLYNEYHVSNSSSVRTFPGECPTGTMTPQEKMFEFSLFDLSTFAPIVKVNPTMTLDGAPNPAKYNQTITMTATVDAPSGNNNTPTGAVTFTEDPSSFGTAALKAGTATQPITSLSPGTHTIKATYSGDPYYNSLEATKTIEVYPPAAVALTAVGNPILLGQSTTITAAVRSSSTAPVPTGTVTFTEGSTLLGTYPLAGGAASFPKANFTNGPHIITATYNGDSNYDKASSSIKVIVQVTSSTTLSETRPSVFLLNPASFTATVGGAGSVLPTGIMTFYEDSKVLGNAPVNNGVAVFSLTTLGMGTHTVTASYSGDDYYVASTSISIIENVMDFTVTATGNAEPSIVHGGTATYSLVVTPVGGTTFPTDIQFGLTGTRYQSVVTFSPDKAASGSGTSAITLTVKTPGYPTLAPGDLGSLKRAAGLIAFGVLLLPFSSRIRNGSKRMKQALCLLIVLAGAFATTTLTGCGAGWPSKGYQFTMTATSGGLQHTTYLNLEETEK